MTKLPVLSAREVLRVLRKAGFDQVSQRGSHIRLKGMRDGETRVVIVPNHREIARGTLASILRQAGFSRDEFLKLLRR
jgi:predicted RNA binding protein YcfA (HicA-like mRNA interferase family)